MDERHRHPLNLESDTISCQFAENYAAAQVYRVAMLIPFISSAFTCQSAENYAAVQWPTEGQDGYGLLTATFDLRPDAIAHGQPLELTVAGHMSSEIRDMFSIN
ncbi:hypothetical protein T265_12106 [Opisthorchis viverrini]|uniref:Uncharacterized protein n=1 Tax=Opisthorchis viverrini TaxID=6198 RepID=A0A074Z6M5_OPIVI|nr:hypothetical protein T265_12106 [Opisthorchis viverrini]KER18900.1 hypothetical protein T265_12106 [Opisthorchis viverrini]